MEKAHRDIICRNYIKLCKMEVEGVLIYLEEDGIFTSEIVEKIAAKGIGRGRELLSRLVRRGPKAFECFRLALINTNQSHLARLLSDDIITPERVTEMRSENLVIEGASNFQIGSNNILVGDAICWSDPPSENEKSEENKTENDDASVCDLTTFKFDLGRDCYVERTSDGGDIVILKYENGKPSSKQVPFPLRRWKELKETVYKIDSAVNEVKAGKEVSYEWHLGGNVYLTVCNEYPTVDIRHFWSPKHDGKVVATRKGVGLRYVEFEQLKLVVEVLR